MKNRLISCIPLWGLLVAFLIISGCAAGTGKLFITKPLGTFSKVSSVDIAEVESTVPVSHKVRVNFDNKLREHLYKEGHFRKGADLRIEYRFIEVNPGSRFMRGLIGFGVGRGSLRVEARFIDSSGNELSSIQAEGTISGGFFGGSFNSAIDRAAGEIAEYTKRNFGL